MNRREFLLGTSSLVGAAVLPAAALSKPAVGVDYGSEDATSLVLLDYNRTRKCWVMKMFSQRELSSIAFQRAAIEVEECWIDEVKTLPASTMASSDLWIKYDWEIKQSAKEGDQ